MAKRGRQGPSRQKKFQGHSAALGYELHITRKTQWFDEEGPSISVEEWLGDVEADPELRLAGDNGPPYLALWSGPSEHPEPWLDWFDGNVYAKYPDKPLIRKMAQIANRLGASVQGDDGETYDEDGLPEERPSTDMTRSSWLTFLGQWGILYLIALSLGLIAFAAMYYLGL